MFNAVALLSSDLRIFSASFAASVSTVGISVTGISFSTETLKGSNTGETCLIVVFGGLM